MKISQRRLDLVSLFFCLAAAALIYFYAPQARLILLAMGVLIGTYGSRLGFSKDYSK